MTVLFADLVDSTGLSQRLDAERAREVLGRFYDTVTEELRALRGQPEKFIGDAVMAVFGLPTVHEDDALRAVRAGLAIRGRVAHLCTELNLPEQLEVRVGIETGEAATGVGPSGQLLVTGTVVNAAARLQTAAEPGQVLIGQTAHALARDSATFGDRRDVSAKGFDEPLVAYPVDGLTGRSVRRTIPFVGRGNELTILRDGFARVVATGRPLLVTVMGEPGIGKSRLADEFIAGLGPETRVLSGRGYVAADSATYAPAATMVRDAVAIDRDDPREKTLRRLREFFEAHPVEGVEDPARMTDRLGLLLGLVEERRDESAFVQDVRAGFLALVEALGTEGPVVLLFEDLHDLRPPMVDLVERLGARASKGPGPVHDPRHRQAGVRGRPPGVGHPLREPARPAPRAAGIRRRDPPRPPGERRRARRPRGVGPRGPHRRQPFLHRRVDRRRDGCRAERAHRAPGSPHRAGGRRGPARRAPTRSSRSRPASVRLPPRVRPRGGQAGGRLRGPGAHGPGGRRDRRAGGGDRTAPPSAGGCGTRPCARSRTRASRSVCASSCTSASRTR